MITLGPYRYTPTDAMRTLQLAGSWLDELERGIDAVGLGEHRERLVKQFAAALSLTPSLGLARLAVAAAKAPERHAELLPALMQAVAEITSQLRSEARVATVGAGTVAQLNRSGGGVPKTPVQDVTVAFNGVEGDRQRSRVHHGRPWQALCLWSEEVIDTLAADGHPIAAGSAGENVTIAGLPWGDVRPGVRMRIGEVLCEASLYALPCKKNAQWFRDGDYMLMHHERGPFSRMYATVLEPGRIRAGDPVFLEP